MNIQWLKMVGLATALSISCDGLADSWSLQDCLEYARNNNIQLQKSRIQVQAAREDWKQAKAELLPSLNASTNHNVIFRPWPNVGAATVANGYVETSVDKTYYNGNYSIVANWVLWNGNQNRNTVKRTALAIQQREMEENVAVVSLEEKITQLYFQILYAGETVVINSENLVLSRKNEERGMALLKAGKLSKADVAQLSAQRAQDEYNVAFAEGEKLNYTRQLKELLQITGDDTFRVSLPETLPDVSTLSIPAVSVIYDEALNTRPEIKNAQFAIETSRIELKIAKAKNLPIISTNASWGTNTTSMSQNAWTKQLKTNFDMGIGLSIALPLFDNRNRKTAVNKANIQIQNTQLDLKEKQSSLYSTIENYWLQATTSQHQYHAAKVSKAQAQISYELLQEQFSLGLKNIIELMSGKATLISSQQKELQAKYMTVLNFQMLQLYRTKDI